MAVMAECPFCHRKQKVKNKKCVNKNCQMDLAKERRNYNVRYWIVYRLTKKQIWELVAPNPETGKSSIEDANASEGKRRGQRREGKLKTILDIKPKVIMTFQELSDQYLAQPFAQNKGYVFRLSLRRFNEYFGNKIVDQIKDSDLRNYQAKREQEDYARSTIAQQIDSGKGVIRQAYRDKKIDQDTYQTFLGFTGLHKRNGKVKEITVSNDQFNAIYENIKDRSKNPFKILYRTGCREGEILNLRWNRVLWDKREIQLRAEDTKEKKEKIIPMDEEVYSILSETYERVKDQSKTVKQVTPEDFVFNHRKGHLNKDHFIWDLRQACKKTGIPYGRFNPNGITCHTLRHTLITNAGRANVPPIQTMAITGHSSTEMHQHYSHPDTDDLRRALAAINKYASGEIKPEGNVNLQILKELKGIKEALVKTLNLTPLQSEETNKDQIVN